MKPDIIGRRILVVEDQYFIADDLARFIRRHGAEVVGPAPSREQAIALLDQQSVDVAVLDINLAGLAVYPVAEELSRRGIPFVFLTGYAQSVVKAEFANAPHIDKPFMADELLVALRELISGQATTSSDTRH